MCRVDMKEKNIVESLTRVPTLGHGKNDKTAPSL